MKSAYVITRDGTGSTIYFVRLGLGIFWECTSNLAEARRFYSRRAASAVLVDNGKNRQGWRVVPIAVQNRTAEPNSENSRNR